MVLCGLFPLIPTSSKFKFNFLALSTEAVIEGILLPEMVGSAFTGLGNVSDTLTLLNERTPKLE
jgi:hypothetical protein